MTFLWFWQKGHGTIPERFVLCGYESRRFGGKKSTSSKHRDQSAYLLFDGKNIDCTNLQVCLRDSTFWREKVDFIKTLGWSRISTFWRKKFRLHQCTGLNTRLDFLAGKNSFSIIHISKCQTQLFGGKKLTSSKYWDKNGYRLFSGKKSSSTKHWDIIGFRLFGGKKIALIHSSKYDTLLFGRKKVISSKH